MGCGGLDGCIIVNIVEWKLVRKGDKCMAVEVGWLVRGRYIGYPIYPYGILVKQHTLSAEIVP